jgi:hypothetical protein
MSVNREGIFCSRIVFADSEFNAYKGQGKRPGFPLCFCAIEFFFQNGRVSRVIEHRLSAPYPAKPPWERGDPYPFIGWAISAEAGSIMNINIPDWTFPSLVIDLYAEYMTIHNTEMSRGDGGKTPPSLIEACRRYHVAGMDKTHKEEMRALVYTKDNHTPEEIAAECDYCIDDCWMTARLFVAMRPFIDLLRAPIRGAYMLEIERMRWHGIPIDTETYYRVKHHAPAIVAKMRAELNRKLGTQVYYKGVFKRKTMFALMRRNGIPIPIDPKTGKESLSTKLIKTMIETYPLLKHYYEDKRMIDALQDLKLEIGDDNRNRSWANPFGQKTGRNNFSTNRYLLGLPHTMRSFMKPGPGMAIAYVDYGAQEVGIAAANSRDPTLISDYLAGDPYKQFAKAELDIENPTKQQRQVFKATVLGRIYGQGTAALARNLGISRAQAERINDQMNARYPVLNAWLDRVCIKAAHFIPIVCTLGWSLTASGRPGEERTFLNFPMQANGAETMRVVIIRAGTAGLKVIACAHDGFFVEDFADKIEESAAKLQAIMVQVSRDLFNGFELRADCDPAKDIVRDPDRFVDEREREDGMAHWNWLMSLIAEEENDEPGQSRLGQSQDYRSGFDATDEPAEALAGQGH